LEWSESAARSDYLARGLTTRGGLNCDDFIPSSMCAGIVLMLAALGSDPTAILRLRAAPGLLALRVCVGGVVLRVW
jgi:hypothetical protein